MVGARMRFGGSLGLPLGVRAAGLLFMPDRNLIRTTADRIERAV